MLPYILLLLGSRILFVLSRLLSYRGLLNQGSTLINLLHSEVEMFGVVTNICPIFSLLNDENLELAISTLKFCKCRKHCLCIFYLELLVINRLWFV